ncbi:hypothetical protein BH23GEM6_BH23GEM6_11890 [soil metagenome]
MQTAETMETIGLFGGASGMCSPIGMDSPLPCQAVGFEFVPISVIAIYLKPLQKACLLPSV